MLNLEIYEPDAPESSPPTRIALVRDDDGISIVAVDAAGDELAAACLAVLTKDGQLLRPGMIASDLGFDLDNEGRIRLATG